MKVTVDLPPILTLAFREGGHRSVLSFAVEGPHSRATIILDGKRTVIELRCPCPGVKEIINKDLARTLHSNPQIVWDRGSKPICLSHMHCLESVKIAFFYSMAGGKAQVEDTGVSMETVVALHHLYYGGAQLHQEIEGRSVLTEYFLPVEKVRLVYMGNTLLREKRGVSTTKEIGRTAVSGLFRGLTLSAYGFMDEALEQLRRSSSEMLKAFNAGFTSPLLPIIPLSNGGYLAVVPQEHKCSETKKRLEEELERISKNFQQIYETRLSHGGLLFVG